MDIIDNACKKNALRLQLYSNEIQNWDEFQKVAVNRKVYIFGTGAAAGQCMEYIPKGLAIHAFVDNDERKHGHSAGDYIAEICLEPVGERVIISPEQLGQENTNDIVVLITSPYYFSDISEQLSKMKINHVYSYLHMEVFRRKNNNISECFAQGKTPEEYMEEFSKLPIKKNKIVFVSFEGVGTYCDHGKYISERLTAMRPDLDVVWLVKDLNIDVPNNIRLVLMSNIRKRIYEMATAKVWVDNDPVPPFIKKRQDQIFIETKHWASVTLKKFYLDDESQDGFKERRGNWIRNGKMMDYVLTGSDFDCESFRRGFWFDKKEVRVGSPRTDAMFLPEKYKAKVASHYGLNPSHKFLLYAPTFRYETGTIEQTVPKLILDIPRLIDILQEKFGGTWNVLLRLHPEVARLAKNQDYVDNLVDTSLYDDSEELAAASDIMISDYSSIMFEPAFVGKPVFLFAYDKDTYVNGERDLLLDYDKLPFPISTNNDELCEQIKRFDIESYKKSVKEFLQQFNVQEDGKASFRAAKFISDLMR